MAAPLPRSLSALALQTWRTVFRRWAVPLSLVGVPLLWAQVGAGPPDPWAVVQAAGVVGAIVLGAPLLWRLLFPAGRAPSQHPGRVAAYGGVGLIAVWGTTGVEGFRYALTSGDPGPWFALGLFLVTGMALGRDVELELSVAAARARAEALAKQAEHAELRAIRAHLDPHFLFNTMGAIAEWVREDPVVAEQALLRLSDLLRTVLTAVRTESWPLERELELVDGLAELYRVRDPERFGLDRTGSGPPGMQVPPMLLLSMVENAFKHGPAAGNPGRVEVLVADQDGLRVEVRNPGPYRGPREGGEGLDLLRRRVELAWGGRGRFAIGGAGSTTAVLHVSPAPAEKR